MVKNLKKKLKKMSIEDLQWICNELNIVCDLDKDIMIKKLLKPLSKKYKMKKSREALTQEELDTKIKESKPIRVNFTGPENKDVHHLTSDKWFVEKIHDNGTYDIYYDDLPNKEKIVKKNIPYSSIFSTIPRKFILWVYPRSEE